MDSMGIKLAHALFYRRSGKILPPEYKFTVAGHQLQRPEMRPMTEFLAQLLPDQTIGGRLNMDKYGERFGFKCGYKPENDYFIYAAQFGRGLLLWGIVLGTGGEPTDPSSPLGKAVWRYGGTWL